MSTMVFYVWFDAPIGYISITANYCGDGWEAWWKSPQDVELVQFMGKDNVPFHTVIFPATLLGTQEPWTMMKSISVTEYLNYEDGKFSKSRGVGVFGNDAKDTGIPVEVWRYYLLAVRPESSDSAFQWDDFAAKNNAELNDNLGNFINRTLKFIYARFDKAVPGPAASGAGMEAVKGLGEKVSALVEQYIAALEGLRMKEALRTAMMVSKAGNAFFQETEIWVAYKQDKDACSSYISACAGIVLLCATLLQPFMPSFTRKVMEQLGVSQVPDLTDDLVQRALNPAALLPAGHPIGAAEPTPLFRKITDDEVAQLRARYAGNQADRNAAAPAASSSSAAAPAGGKAAGKAAGKGATKGGDSKAAAKAADGGKADGAAAGKGKKEKGDKAAAAGGGKGSKEPERPADISRIDLRVGLIKKAWRHPDAESLYVEEVDVGEEQPRTVVSGLVKFIPEAEMQQRRVVLVCNLKPANMRGIQSQAMVLAATSPDGSRVELVEPPAGAAIGERLRVDGFDCSQPDEQLNPKKKVFEAVAPDLATSEQTLLGLREAFGGEGSKKRHKNRCGSAGPVPFETNAFTSPRMTGEGVFYVWFDAPIGYISITANYCGDGWEAWWKSPQDVELVQFMRKDNVPFHTCKPN
ncbi:putative methionine--tRNA ligase [Chlorella sorokiniana]|uniref:methionine--tRNA ligase n=1 Tax=Chlorella sorokiniana TaxID=3076 RepID=A0A2P6TEL0_CHLSO|nr:putative methionine--tRNA ligase [Chlorella sorokiniana]|eukprot:PRW21084.1 putative methionine--tRNA ligase [Chlorella sorokiniana]